MIIRNNKRKLFSSALSFEEITSLSHEIAKKVISGKLTKEEAIVEVMNKANWSYGYADAAVSSWIENEPTYNGMVMSSFVLHYKNDDGEDSVWGIYDTKEEAESEIEKFRTTGFGPNPTFCEIIESSRKAIKSNAKDDKRSYEINRENKATLSWGDFCDSLSEDFVMDGIFRTVPGDHHWSEIIGDLVVVLSVSEDNPLQGNFSLYKRGNFKKPLRTEYKRFNDADEAKELMYQFIESSEKFDDNNINSSRKAIKSDFEIYKGAKFKNQNGATIEIVRKDDDGYVLFKTYDGKIRDANEDSVKNMLRFNKYTPIQSARKPIESEFNHFYNPATDYIDEDLSEYEEHEYSQFKVEEGYYLTPRRDRIRTYTVYTPDEKYIGQTSDSNKILDMIRGMNVNSSRKPIKSSTYQFVCEFDGKYEPRVISYIGDQGVIWEDADENYDNAKSFSESELPAAVRSIVKNEDDYDDIEIVKDNGDSVFIKEFIREGSFDNAWQKAVEDEENWFKD